tara:strand:- start:1235 stop:1888 length:654 start_codon:yes stop_codon:yes gene_type:complete
MKTKYLYLILFFYSIIFSQASNDLLNSITSSKYLLNETQLHPIPEGMTFEEYQDMNRQITTGLLLTAIPIPGTLHSYANELKTARRIRYAFGGGVLSIFLGLISQEENGYSESEYNTFQDSNSNKIYEMIPIGQFNGETTYEYRVLEKEYSGGVGFFILGFGAIVGSYVYDYIHGIKIIEHKRAKVRYKYGKELNFSIIPSYDMYTQSSNINLIYQF